MLANRPDIIREDYMNELCILQDDVPSFPNQVPECPFHGVYICYFFVEQPIIRVLVGSF